MADGTNFIALGRVIQAYELDCPTLATLSKGQMVVGCCPRCAQTGRVDIESWRSPRDQNTALSALQYQAACICGCRQVSFQVWPERADDGEHSCRIYRWRS